MYYNEIESIVFGNYGTSEVTKIETEAKYLKLHYYDTDQEVKLFADLYHVQKTDDDFCEIVKTSDFLLISTYDKVSKQTTNMELLEVFPQCSRYFFSNTDREKNLRDLVKKTFGLSEDSWHFIVSQDLYDYVRRIVFLKQRTLFKTFQTELHSYIEAFIPYLNNLDDIEKLSSVMKPEAIIKQMRDKTLKFNDGSRKLKQLVGVPVDIMQQLNDYGIGHRLSVFQSYINDKGGVDDVRKLFDWLAALKKLNRKRKIRCEVHVDTQILEKICDILHYGASIPNLMSVVSREILMYSSMTHVDLSDILRTIKDTLIMLEKIEYPNRTINQNVDKWHFITARNCKLITDTRAEEYSAAVAIINEKSTTIDGYLIKCPETEKELFDIGNAYNNCLPIYRDKIIDDGAIIYSMYAEDQVEKVPSVTFEVTKDYEFVQIKTFNDMDVIDEQIMEVLKKWRKFARKENKNGQKVYASQQSC